MNAGRRRSLLLAAWFATAVASGALVAWALNAGGPERDAGDVSSEATPLAPPILAADPRGLHARADVPSASPPDAPAAPKIPEPDRTPPASEADADASPPTLAVAWIDVTAVAGPGPARARGTAYAVPSGASAPGEGEDDPWPRVSLDGEGRGRIPLPAAGRWDVGVANGISWGMARDVDVEASGARAVTVQLTGTAELEVEVPETRGRALRIDVEPVAGMPTSREFPTRAAGWAYRGSRGYVTLRGPTVARLWVPTDVWVRVVGEMTDGPEATRVGLRSDPEQVMAPARVRLVTTPAAPAQTILVVARLCYATPPPTPRRIEVSFDVRGVDGGEITSGTSDPEVLVPDERESGVRVRLSTPPHAVRVSWRGIGVYPGEVVVPAAVGAERRRIEVDVEVDPAGCPELLERVAFLGGRSVAAREGERPSVWIRSLEGVEPLSLEEDGRVSGDGANRIVGSRLAVATDGYWWASEAVALPSSGTARIPLSPAGYLHLVPEVPLEPRLGRAELVRADGGPLTALGERAWRAPVEAFDGEVKPGLLLGPFPRGEIEFVLKLGGVERRRIRATVRAGRITALPLAW